MSYVSVGDDTPAGTGTRVYDTTTLQSMLTDAGFPPKGGIDGVYGSGTAAAVTAFQKAKGLSVDGVAGPQVWGALGVSGAPTLRQTTSGATATTTTTSKLPITTQANVFGGSSTTLWIVGGVALAGLAVWLMQQQQGTAAQ